MLAKARLPIAFAIAGMLWLGWLVDGSAASKLVYSKKARLEAIHHAQVWIPTDVASKDIKAGPQGPGAFAPNETVTCDYVDKKMSGNSPKFTCQLPAGDDPKAKDEVKVKYGRNNGEVYGEVASTRLLWALGFGADRMYPVRVICHGCPAAPRPSGGKGQSGDVTFDPAAIEREMDGRAIVTEKGEGWAWPELDLIDESAGGAPLAQRDGLKLLAVILQHTDSKAEQQRLVCLSGGGKKARDEKSGDVDDEECPRTFMMINDLGMTFGHASLFNRASVSGVNFEQWSRTAVWSDAKHCVGNMTESQTGTLEHPVISEAGRKFLADLLVQLSDRQLHDLFDVARFPERTTGSTGGASVDEWVHAFDQKRDAVVNQTCP